MGVIAAEQNKQRTENTETYLQHYAAIHPTKHLVQPVNSAMGSITNEIKKMRYSKRYTTQQILESFSNGQCIMLSNFELDTENRIRFLSSSAIALDVDDDERVTNPLEVLESLKDICAGLFYTFSHGKKGNRYRLFFQLDQSITKQEELNALIDYLIVFLKNKGLPVDGKAKSPISIIRGGKAGYEINSLETTLKVSEWLPKAKYRAAERLRILEEQRKQRAKEAANLPHPVTFEELQEMCQTIGHLPTGSGDDVTQKWLQIVYALKHQVQMGLIDDQQGYELFDIVSGGESTEKYWRSLRPYGQVSIGTIVHHAKEAGYKRKHKYKYAMREASETIEVERIRSKGYLTTEIAKDLLKRHQRLLVDSPTGSRKTSSFMNAFKELATENNKAFKYFIFATPTIPLTEQVAKEHDVMGIVGGIGNLRNKVVDKALAGNRIFVTTYDKTAEVISYLSEGIDYGSEKQPEFHIVIDEIHKFTEAYSYRFNTIDRLEELTKLSASVIGLSGTTEDILRDNFDKLIEINTGNKKSPCLDYRVFTYNKKDDADVLIVPVIKGLLKQTRVLLFLNNKDRIDNLVKKLTAAGIKTQKVTSDTKQSQTYLNIVENGKIDDSVQVVISTTVLADGLSINNDLNWSCLVMADRGSPLFNPSSIKQISNRFRAQYRYFALYIQQPNPEYAESARFYIESEYQYRKKIVNGYVNYLNTEFPAEELQNFLPSKVEKHNGIYYRSTDEAAKIEFNPLFVRHQSMKQKETHYGIFRNAFIEEVSRQLGHKCTGVYNVNEEAEKNGADLSGLIAEQEKAKEEQKTRDSDLRDAFKIYFDESVYTSFLRDNEEALALFKKDVHPDQYAATKKNVHIADFETCLHIGSSIERKADMYRYFNDIKSLAEIASFDYVKKTNVTKRIFNEICKVSSKKYLSSDLKELLEKTLPKMLKVKSSDVKEALKLFHKFSKKHGGEAYAMLKPLTPELVAKVRHEVSTETIENSILRYTWNQNGHQQNILLPAILEKWNIQNFKEQQK